MSSKRLKPKPKFEKSSWNKRNEARSVLQRQHAERVAKAEAARVAADAFLGTESATA